MAFKLDKQESLRRAGLVASLQEAWGKIEDAVDVYNDAVAELKGPVAEAIEAYNEIATEAAGFAEDVATRAEGEFDDKSEKWQESERGQAAGGWRDEWQSLDLATIEPEFPDDLAIDDPGHADALEGLPDEASE